MDYEHPVYRISPAPIHTIAHRFNGLHLSVGLQGGL
jgi:hypothetical protein